VQLTFESTEDLSLALVRAAAAHGKHEEETGQADPNWPIWYSQYLEHEQAGQSASPSAARTTSLP
jgi:hypothetical protein